jgi:hypothetical protein
VIETAAHAVTPEAADPAFAAVIFDMDRVVTDTAGLQRTPAGAATLGSFMDGVRCGWKGWAPAGRRVRGRGR